MLLIILLILSQDASFNVCIHKLVRNIMTVLEIFSYHYYFSCLKEYACQCLRYIDTHVSNAWLLMHQVLPSVPWYKERLLTQTTLGSLMVVILIRTVNYNLSKLRVGLKTNHYRIGGFSLLTKDLAILFAGCLSPYKLLSSSLKYGPACPQIERICGPKACQSF